MKRQAAKPSRYPIRAASKLTGIGIDTLRAWERRYGAVTPGRDDRGRMYIDADIARLRLLRSVVEHGHSIRRLAGLSDEDLRHLAAAVDASAAPAVGPRRPAPFDTAAIIASVRAFNSHEVDLEVARMATLLGPLELLQDVLMPVLVQVGDDWHRGRIGVAHEHLLSSTIRHAIGSFLRLYTRPDPPSRLLFATPAGESHEIGTLGAAMLAANSGLGVAYLGPDLPADEIVESVEPARTRVLVLGLTMARRGQATQRALRTIVRDLPREVELWTGGHGAVRNAAIISPRGLIFSDYTSYQQQLVRIGGRSA
jgi:methanogenic corrinoid protein MtbC1